jgi:UDP-N-acetylmuramoylalanine--D-glutamate ligase
LVTVVGLARSGAAAADWLLRLGCIVRVTEQRRSPELEEAAEPLRRAGAMVELGAHSPDFIRGSQLVVASPGVVASAPPIRSAGEEGIPVVGELELGSWYCAGPILAVTGSNGKSTVVTLVGEILRAAGKEHVVCGNIGQPICRLLPRIRPATIVVLEVSSFQLDRSLTFHPQIGCLLNVTDNHLDRHRSFDQYRQAKARLFAFQSSSAWAVLNADDPEASRLRSGVRGRLAFFSRIRKGVGAYLDADRLTLTLPFGAGPICRRDELFRSGIHHEENALAAACLAGLLGVSPEVIGSVLRSFPGLPHRQQVVATVSGITFVNDSKATTVTAALRAIQAMPGKGILIAGGRDKGSDFRPLRFLRRKLKGAVLIGEDGPKIAASLKGVVPLQKAKDLREAVGFAYGMARPGEWVLLSPMCTSFDMFRDFEERGERFVEAVHALS